MYEEIKPRQDGVVGVAQVRVRGSWRPFHQEWAEIVLEVQVADEWLPLTPPGRPLVVARRRSGSSGAEAPELSVIAALKANLTFYDAEVLRLWGGEKREVKGFSVESWSYWAELGARLTVAWEYQDSGAVALLPLR